LDVVLALSLGEFGFRIDNFLIDLKLFASQGLAKAAAQGLAFSATRFEAERSWSDRGLGLLDFEIVGPPGKAEEPVTQLIRLR
jgi:hypothetical protein